MRRARAHIALDGKTPRWVVSQRLGALALHDTVREKEYVLYSVRTGNRGGIPWCRLDAEGLADWLNEREAGYPRLMSLGKYDRSDERAGRWT